MSRRKLFLIGGVGGAVMLTVILLLTLGGNALTTSTKTIHVDGVYADMAYESASGDNIVPLYVYLSIKATDEDLKLYSRYITLTFNDNGQYESEFLNSLNAHQEKYYYGHYIQHLYGGETGYLVFTVLVPVSRLDSARSFTLSADHIPGIEDLRIGTKSVVRLESDEAICSQIDPEGFAHNVLLREPASDERASAVENNLTGRYWLVNVGNSGVYCRVEFMASRQFSVTLSNVTNSGTYDIREGYLYCSYDGGLTYPLQIPYTIDENGKVDLTFSGIW